jgi:hypothetical protein
MTEAFNRAAIIDHDALISDELALNAGEIADIARQTEADSDAVSAAGDTKE